MYFYCSSATHRASPYFLLARQPLQYPEHVWNTKNRSGHTRLDLGKASETGDEANAMRPPLKESFKHAPADKPAAMGVRTPS